MASVGRGDEVVAAARTHRPDVALLDIEMPGIDGLAAAGLDAAQLAAITGSNAARLLATSCR